jgi:DNA repair exonuclease SbcCD nuclease subunit
LIPVYGGDGSLVAAVAAVPFIHEYRLGVSKGTRQNYANEIKDAFRDVYDHFAKLAQEKYPGVPHIAMGHLTAMNEAEVVGSAPQNVHIAVENGMDGSIFGDSYDYIALGHIHKNYRVRGTANAYYCGSPLPCSIDEAEDSQNRGVWFVDLSVSKIPVQRALPALREFIRWKEDISTLEQKLISLTWPKEQEPPFVWLCVQTGTPRYDLWDSFTQLLLSRTKEERPILVNIDNVVGSENVESEERVDISTTPHEIFDALLQYKEIPKTPQLQGLFDELLSKVTSLKEEKV